MKNFFLASIFLLMTAAFANAQDIGISTVSAPPENSNPFLVEWTTPFGVPPFDKIQNTHFMPAFESGMIEQNQEIEAIVGNPKPATFGNTLAALDRSGQLLEKVSSVFFGLNSANTNPEMQGLAKKLSPLLSKHNDDINLNPLLFERVKAVYNARETVKYDPDQLRLIEETYKNFIRGGAGLDSASKARLRELNTEISMLQLTFGQNLLAENNAYKLVIDRKEDLSGLPQDLISTSAEIANTDSATKGKWVFTLQNPSVMPFLQFSDKRELREKIFTAYINRCNKNDSRDNTEIIKKLVMLREKKARLMGFDSFAAFMLDDRMAKTPANVYSLLNQVWTPALAMAKKERDNIQQLIRRSGGKFECQGWDWRYYSEKVRKARFNLDEETIKPYFKLENVRDGIFYVARKLYGITFSEVRGAPAYYKGVRLYECHDKDGSLLGVVYMDFHPRAGKRGGAWCGSYRSQSNRDGKRIAPVMTIVCNFSAPTADKPALLTADEVETFFHEFGHNLAGLFRNVRYDGIGGVPRDFVELPSQINEHWAFEPEVLKVYAKHYLTGAVIPQALVDKIVKSGKYGEGFKTTEYLAASFLDMDYHTSPEVENNLDVLKFETESMNKIGLIEQIPPRYRSTYFQHSMTGGYTAGYYSYIWAEVLDADAFQAFKEAGNIFDQATATKFRKAILEKGGSKDAMQMYLDFRGKEPSIDALLENRGLK
ncbi:MAG: M3 family metallopeptidase [Bacteroidetes bacterium]|nr:M3 family metallopeptidase [Bacteroidota bacterium]